MDHFLFLRHCYNGDLEKAKEVSGDKINYDCKLGDVSRKNESFDNWYNVHQNKIYACDDDIMDIYSEALLCACWQGHLEVVQWLISLGIKVNNRIFHHCTIKNYSKKHIAVAQWLCSINKNLKINMKNDCISEYIILNDQGIKIAGLSYPYTSG